MGEGAAEHLVQSPGPSASSWAPHGRALTACLVALNVFLVLLVYVYFWRFFSRAPPRGRGDEEDAAASSEEDGSSPPASPKARDVDRAITALPVFVHASSDSSNTSNTECAICIAEFADGEEGRLLPRCGHRFHARCVDTWFRAHTTCPLCRDTVLHVAGRDAHTKEEEAAVTTTTTTTANRSSDTDTSSDCPV